MQDKGENITKYVSGYVIKNHNISLYDNPGIETINFQAIVCIFYIKLKYI